MKKMFISTIIAVMVVSIGLYAQEDKTQGDFRIRLELVYKRRLAELIGPEGFPSSGIKQILEQEDIPQEDRDWLLNSLRIEIARRDNTLYTAEGKAIELHEDIETIATSENQKYMLLKIHHLDYGELTAEEVREKVQRLTREAQEASDDQLKSKKYKELVEFQTEVRKKKNEWRKYILMRVDDGKILWVKEDREEFAPQFYISNDGKTVIAVPGSCFFNTAIFYDERANEKKRVMNLWGPQDSHGMSADGEMFYALTRMAPGDTSSMAIAAYDNSGNQLWKTAVKGSWPSTNPSFAVSPNGNYVSASVAGTFLFDNEGATVNTYNCATYFPAFSLDGKYLVIGTLRDTIYFVRTDNGAVLWQKSLGGHSYKQPIVAKDGHTIFFISRAHADAGQPGYLLNKNGDIIWQRTNELKNAIGLSPSGYFFIPSTNPEVIIYRIFSEVQDEE